MCEANNRNNNNNSISSMTNTSNSNNRCLSFNLQTNDSQSGQGPYKTSNKKYSLKCIFHPSFYFTRSSCKNAEITNNTTTTMIGVMKCVITFLLGFTMIGVTSMSRGKTYLTYMDSISNSNSNYHPNNVQKSLDENTFYQDQNDQTKIVAKTMFPLYFSNNDSLSCINAIDNGSTSGSSSSSSSTSSESSSSTSSKNGSDCKDNHLPQQAYEYESFNNDENTLYLNETDYNLLLNVTTQIGSFDPLPSTFVSTTKPVVGFLLNNNNNNNNYMNIYQYNNIKTRKMIKPKRFIPILEARGTPDRDIDKNEYGHRRDTLPIASAIDSYLHEKNKNHHVQTAVFQFLEEENGQNHYAVQSNIALKEYLRSVAHGIVVRINPGTLSPTSQKKCDDMLRELSRDGLVVLSHPDVSSTLGAKDSLVKIRDLKCGMDDTEVYYTPESFHQGFRRRISYEPRVIKQNRGCQGEGVWIVKLKDENAYCRKDSDEECIVSLDAELELMEAFDNHVEYHTVKEFLDFCSLGRLEDSPLWTTTSGGKYFDGGLDAGAMVVDQRFLPRIVEGEVRCLMVGSELVEIVHKKPKEGGLSATLESGAIYTRYPPDHPKFAKLVKNFKEDVPRIMDSFGMADQPLPLLWTVDYIYGETDDDLYAGEINCSCPGITKQLHIAPTIAKVAYESVFAER